MPTQVGRDPHNAAGLLLLLTLVLMAWGFWEAWPAPALGGGLSVPHADIDVGTLPLNETRVVPVTVVNTASRPLRVIGLPDDCGLNCCVRAQDPQPVSVPAGGQCSIPFTVKARRNGPFEQQREIFVEGNGIQTLIVRVHGEAVGGPEPVNP